MPANDFHKPLPNEESCKWIRLLDLHDNNGSSDRPLSGTLRHVRLIDQPTYAALSYARGGWPIPASTITCNDVSLSITENCHNALEALRNQCGPLTIWVDSICTDKENDLEVFLHIQLMNEIYSNAHTTYIWLGRGGGVVDAAAECVRLRARLPSPFREIDEKRNAYAIKSKLWNAMKLLVAEIVSSLHTARSKRKVKNFELSYHSRALLCTEWLSCTWTFQDFLFASEIVLVRGQCHLEWEKFRIAVSRENKCSADILEKWKSLIRLREDFLCSTDYDSDSSESTKLKNEEIVSDNNNNALLLVREVWKDLLHRNASQPKQRVSAYYGILSRLGVQLATFLENKSFSQVYSELFILLVTNDPYLLSSLALCRAFALDVPSWVPDWHGNMDKRWILPYVTEATARFKEQPEPEFNIQGRKLQVSGLWRSRITSRFASFADNCDKLLTWCHATFDSLLAPVLLDVIDLAQKLLANNSAFTKADLIDILLKSAPGTLDERMRSGFFSWFEPCWTEIEPWVNGKEKPTYEDARKIARWSQNQDFFINLSEESSHIRATFLGTGNILGYASSDIAEGDHVATIMGVPVPMVLRESVQDPGCYTVIGCAHIDHLMGWDYYGNAKFSGDSGSERRLERAEPLAKITLV